MDSINQLAKIPLFSELTDQQQKAIVACGSVRHYPKNVVLISEGDPTDSMFVTLSGRVRVFATGTSGREVTLGVLGAGDFFGELALIDPAPRSASIITLAASEFWVISKQDFELFLSKHPEATTQLLRHLVRQVRALTEQVKNLALRDVYGRVVQILMSLSVETAQGDRIIHNRLTHQEIANRAGASREMVSKIMKELTRGDYISLRNRRIAILKKLPAPW